MSGVKEIKELGRLFGEMVGWMEAVNDECFGQNKYTHNFNAVSINSYKKEAEELLTKLWRKVVMNES